MSEPRTSSKILLTAFEPFGGDTGNSSACVVQALDGKQISNHRVVAAVLPVAYDDSAEMQHELLAKHKPALVIGIGQCNRGVVLLERVSINIIDHAWPDNKGVQPIEESVIADGPAAYFSKLPLRRIVARLKQEGIPAEISLSAGAFTCNALFHHLMHELTTRKSLRHTLGGFMHLPRLPQQTVNSLLPSMSLDLGVKAVKLAVRTTLAEPAKPPASPQKNTPKYSR